MLAEEESWRSSGKERRNPSSAPPRRPVARLQVHVSGTSPSLRGSSLTRPSLSEPRQLDEASVTAQIKSTRRRVSARTKAKSSQSAHLTSALATARWNSLFAAAEGKQCSLPGHARRARWPQRFDLVFVSTATRNRQCCERTLCYLENIESF